MSIHHNIFIALIISILLLILCLGVFIYFTYQYHKKNKKKHIEIYYNISVVLLCTLSCVILGFFILFTFYK